MALTVKEPVNRQIARPVDSHRESDRVAPGDIPILLSIVQLIPFLVKPVNQILRAAAGLAIRQTVRTGRRGRWDKVVDRKRLVEEVTDLNREGHERPHAS